MGENKIIKSSSMDDIVKSLNEMKMTEFKEKLQTISFDTLFSWKTEFDNRYYNTGEETIEDLKYDFLVEYILKLNPMQLPIGCKLREEDNKAKLPFRLGGMDKIKMGEEEKLVLWKTKNPFQVVFSDKLNGVSCLVVYNSKTGVQLFTRGDGEVGADISYLKTKIQNLPQKMKTNIAVRGELIIKTSVFQEKWQKEYKNSLSLIVSVVNSKSLKQPIEDIEFLAYEIVSDGKQVVTPFEQFHTLVKLGFQTPFFQTATFGNLNFNVLSAFLNTRKSASAYDIDGIIVQADYTYDRSNTTSGGNPSYAFAFKMLMDVAQATVTDVEWSPSKWGVLKPRICITPTQLCGITICHTTGFNAAFIRDNKINIGTQVLITRSGDIIPYIVKVLESEAVKVGKMPEIAYEWNESGVDIVVTDITSKEVEIQKLVHFFVSIGVKQMNEGIVTKLYDNGLKTIEQIVSASKERLLLVPTIKEKMAERILTNLQGTLSSVQLADFLTGSGIFGMGIAKKKIELLLSMYPDLIFNKKYTKEDICKVQGFSDKLATKIMDGLPLFSSVYEPIEKFITIIFPMSLSSEKEEEKEKEKEQLPLQGQTFVFSKIRDEKVKSQILALGGNVSESVSSKTSGVITNSLDDSSSKIEKAKKLNIRIWSMHDFCSFLSLNT